MNPDKIQNAFLKLVNSLYISLTSLSISLFVSVRQPDGTLTTKGYTDVEFGGPAWATMLPAAPEIGSCSLLPGVFLLLLSSLALLGPLASALPGPRGVPTTPLRPWALALEPLTCTSSLCQMMVCVAGPAGLLLDDPSCGFE